MPTYDETMSGGVTASGDASWFLTIGLPGSGGSGSGGTSAFYVLFPEEGSGGATISGSASSGYSINIVGSGGAEAAGVSPYNATFDQAFYWNVNATVNFDKEFSWSLGAQPLRWYRVQGVCVWPTSQGSGVPGEPYPGGCEVTGIQIDDSQCTGAVGKVQFIQNILATTVQEVCNELTKSRINWQLQSIKRWSRPADPLLVPEGDECNVLEDVPFRDIPECLNFTLEIDSVIQARATVLLNENFFIYSGSGAITTGGAASTIIKSGGTTPTVFTFFFSSSGGSMTLGGSGFGGSSLQNDYLTEVVATVAMEFQEIVFGESGDPLGPLTTRVVTGCGTCDAMPIDLFLDHELASPGLFRNFLMRNGFKIPKSIELYHSARQDAWVGNLHYSGFSDDNLTTESWRFTFEFSCTNDIAGDNTGSPVIKFAMLVVRKNLVNGIDEDTRLFMVLPPVDFCAYIRNFKMNFGFTLNLDTLLVVNDAGLIPQSVLLKDNIGMFSSQFFDRNPNLPFRLSRVATTSTVGRLDISPIFPKPDTVAGEEVQTILGLRPSPVLIETPTVIYVSDPVVLGDSVAGA
jgi:hypothetical protein